MAILVVAHAVGMTAEDDEALTRAMGLEGAPSGARIRMAGPTAEGWRIVSLWDSEADYERFRDERLVPALERAGRSLPPVEIWHISSVRPIEAVGTSTAG